jgi:magnesium chelatase family protein
VRARPFRAPHSSISTAGLLGGGASPRAGEITLAHRGVLFLDELPEFRRDALEALRAPLEEKEIRLVRRAGTARFPAAFQLVAAMNPCPCGFLGHPKRGCRCGPEAVRRFRGRVSGPLLDRIDLVLEVAPVEPGELFAKATDETDTADAARERARAARERRRTREFEMGFGPPQANGRADLVHLDAGCRRLLADAMERGGWSARAIRRAIAVARTVADIAGEETIGASHVAESLLYRVPLGDP